MTQSEFLKGLYQEFKPVIEAWLTDPVTYATEVAPTSKGKRQNLLEEELDKAAEKYCRSRGYNLETEGREAVLLSGAKFKVYLDPVDGTSGLARTVGTDFHSSDSALVVVIMPEQDNLKFGSTLASLIINLRSGQSFLAAEGGVFKADFNKSWESYERKTQYSRHTPLLGSDFNRRINRVALGLLIPQEVGWSDLHSSGLNMLQAVIGKVDMVINNPLPSASDDGQRGHELAAMMPFVQSLGAVAIDLRSGKDLAHTPFTFDDMTPSLIAVDQATADYYLTMIEDNKKRPITLAKDLTLTTEEAIKLMMREVSTTSWQLRP